MPYLARNALGIGVKILLSDAWVPGDAFRRGVVASDVFMRLTEITHEPLVRCEVDLLIAKEEDAVRGDCLAQLADLAASERSGQIDIADFGPDIGRGGGDGDRIVVQGFLPMKLLYACN